MIDALCAVEKIKIIRMPPHSSHLLQPLDQGYFRKIKHAFSITRPKPGLSKLTQTVLRIAMAFEEANSRILICRAWEATGIVPRVAEKEIVGLTLNESVLDLDPSLQHAPSPENHLNERERGETARNPKYGIMNEDEMEYIEAGQCPLCYGPIPPTWRLSL